MVSSCTTHQYRSSTAIVCELWKCSLWFGLPLKPLVCKCTVRVRGMIVNKREMEWERKKSSKLVNGLY